MWPLHGPLLIPCCSIPASQKVRTQAIRCGHTFTSIAAVQNNLKRVEKRWRPRRKDLSHVVQRQKDRGMGGQERCRGEETLSTGARQDRAGMLEAL